MPTAALWEPPIAGYDWSGQFTGACDSSPLGAAVRETVTFRRIQTGGFPEGGESIRYMGTHGYAYHEGAEVAPFVLMLNGVFRSQMSS